MRRIAEAEHSHDGGGAAAFAAAGLQVRPLANLGAILLPAARLFSSIGDP